MNAKSSSVSVLLSFGRALLAGALTAAILLLSGTALSLSMGDPAAWARPLALFALLLSAGVCGFVAARRMDNPLPSGALSGGIYLAILIVISLCIPQEESAPSLLISAALYAGVLVAALLGAGLSKKRRRTGAHSHKKRRR